MVVMPDVTPTVATQPASIRERRLSVLLVVALIMASLAVLPSHGRVLGILPAFIPAFAASTAIADGLAASLLLGLFFMDGRRSVLYAGTAYLLNALLIVPYALTFPGVITPGGFIGNEQSAAWLWVLWHIGFASIVATGQLSRERVADEQRTPSFWIAVVWAAAIAGVATLLVTLTRSSLPVLVSTGNFSPLFSFLAAGASLASIAAIGVLLRPKPITTLRLWLIVALAASALDTALNGVAPARYSAAWYVGKLESFSTASVVLVSLIAAWAQLNRRIVALSTKLSGQLAYGRVLRDDFEREHRVSTILQQATLPHSLPSVPGIGLSAAYRSADTEALVGGDWYDAFRLPDGRMVLTVGDVMGSGLEASVVMNAARQAIRGAAHVYPDPATILDSVDGAMRSEGAGTLVTAFVGVVDPMTRVLVYESAGHPPALLRRPDGTIEALERVGLPLGLRERSAAPPDDDTRTLNVEPGSMLLLYTDGLIEAGRDVIAGDARLRSVLSAETVVRAADPAATIADTVNERSHDDVAVLAARFLSDDEIARERVNGSRWRFAAGDGETAARVRREILTALETAGCGAGEHMTTELLFAELVGNVLRHGGSDVEVILDISTATPVLHVLDRGPGFRYASRLPLSMFSESGRGLYIVAALARDFTVSQRAGGGSHARVVLPFELAHGREATSAA